MPAYKEICELYNWSGHPKLSSYGRYRRWFNQISTTFNIRVPGTEVRVPGNNVYWRRLHDTAAANGTQGECWSWRKGRWRWPFLQVSSTKWNRCVTSQSYIVFSWPGHESINLSFGPVFDEWFWVHDELKFWNL